MAHVGRRRAPWHEGMEQWGRGREPPPLGIRRNRATGPSGWDTLRVGYPDTSNFAASLSSTVASTLASFSPYSAAAGSCMHRIGQCSGSRGNEIQPTESTRISRTPQRLNKRVDSTAEPNPRPPPQRHCLVFCMMAVCRSFSGSSSSWGGCPAKGRGYLGLQLCRRLVILRLQGLAMPAPGGDADGNSQQD